MYVREKKRVCVSVFVNGCEREGEKVREMEREREKEVVKLS